MGKPAFHHDYILTHYSDCINKNFINQFADTF